MSEIDDYIEHLYDLVDRCGSTEGLAGGVLEDQPQASPYPGEWSALALLDGEDPAGHYSVGFDPDRDALLTGFTHFEDGIQRTMQVASLNTPEGPVPLYAGLRAAVILERWDGVCDLWGEPRIELRLMMLRPHAEAAGLADDPLVESVSPGGLHLNPTSPVDYARLGPTIIEHVSMRRHALERDLVGRFLMDTDEAARLYLDGTLSHVAHGDRVVGVAKTSHVIIRPLDYRTIYTLAAGERSAAFYLPAQQPEQPTPLQDRLSWFLRLREPVHPTWGLVRVEASPDLTREDVDRVSAWIMAETEPPAIADPRYDRMVYGIHVAERFLRAVVPGHRVLAACLPNPS